MDPRSMTFNNKYDQRSQSRGSGRVPETEIGLINTLDFKHLTKERNKAVKLSFNYSGDAFVAVDAAGHVNVLYLTKNKFIPICKSAYPTCVYLEESENGLVFLGLQDKTVCVYNLFGKLIQTLKGHKNPVTEIQVNRLRNLFVSVSSDACIVWELDSFSKYRILQPKSAPFTSATFSPDGSTMITCLDDSSVSFWNLEDFRVIEKINLPNDSRLTRVITHKTDPYLIAVGEAPILYFFDLRNLPEYHCFQLPNEGSSVLQADIISGQRLVFLGNDNAVYIVDLQRDLRVVLRKAIPRKIITSFAMDHKGKYLLISAESGEIYLYDCEILIHREISTASNFIQLGVPQNMVYPALHEASIERAERVLSRQSPRQRTQTSSPGQSPSRAFDNIHDSYQKQNRRERARSKEFQLVEKKERKSQPAHTQSSGHLHHLHEEKRYDSQPKRNDSHPRKSETLHQRTESLPRRTDSQPHRREEPSEIIQTLHEVVEGKTFFDPDELKRMLGKKGRFTSRDRPRIWRQLLDLPGNKREYEALKSKGLHPAFEELYQRYPIRSIDLFEKLRRILSCLAYHCPLFADIEYLPSMIFPFIKIFDDELLCFEVIYSFLIQWGQHFFQSYPNPPSKITYAIEELIKYHSFDLYAFLKERDIELIYFIWPSIKNLFTDVLLRDDWLALMDFLVYNNEQPIFLIFFLTAYLISFKDALKTADDLFDPEFFKKRQNTVNMRELLRDVHELSRKTPDHVLKIHYRNCLPLPTGYYPRYESSTISQPEPTPALHSQITREQKNLSRRGDEMKKYGNLTETLQAKEEEFRRNQEISRRNEKEARERAIYEEKQRLKKKMEADQEARERRLQQLKAFEPSTHANLASQKQYLAKSGGILHNSPVLLNSHFPSKTRYASELHKEIDYQLEKRARADDKEFKSRRELESLRSTDFEALRKYNHSIEERSKEERAKSLKMIIDHREHENDIMQKIRQERLKAEEDELMLRIAHARKQREVELRLMEQASEKFKHEYQERIDQLDKELRELEIERIRKSRRYEEDEQKRYYEQAKLQKQHEEVLKEQEELQQRKIKEESLALRKAEEKIAALEEEKKRQIEETERYKQKLREIEESHRRAEIMNKSNDLQRDTERRIIEEERKLQSIVADIEKEKRHTREVRDDLALKQREFEERQAIADALRENEEKIMEDEKRKFEEFSRALKEEMDKVNEVKKKMTEVKLQELQRQKQELAITHDMELRKKLQTEQMARYLAEGGEEPEVDSLESARQIRGIGNESLVQEQFEGGNSVKTGGFKSPYSSTRKPGQSSSYQYSATATDDNDPLRYSRSDVKRDLSADKYKYSDYKIHGQAGLSNHSFSYHNRRENGLDPLRNSQEASINTGLQSSPGNLTYSSIGTSSKKDQKYQYRQGYT